ncbi:MAG: hypothetical protein M1817_001231 [Caeruleum heppii]|nr:MAG: hypothetical protein M1817_001231 [Caeruleum heppii]
MPSADRQYELVLFGATGYTGKLTAEHITTHLPSDLRWALAGRSAEKLSGVRDEIRSYNPDRVQPGIEVAQLNKEDLNSLAQKASLLISTVGPYCLYGTDVVEACANQGTHYLDVTGESPWTLEMTRKYHATAKANGAIMIPQIGLESAPADLMSWALVTMFREELGVATKEVILSVHDLDANPSGGTCATLLALLTQYSLKDVAEANKAWALSPVQGTRCPNPAGWLGVRQVPDLGTLTTWIAATTDRAIVHRSWGLMGEGSYYGPRFRFTEHLRVRNYLIAVAIHFMTSVGMLALVFPPVRWLLKQYVYAPGLGPDREVTKRERLEYRAIAISDQDSGPPRRAFARLTYEGGLYYFTGVLLAEAAFVILRGQDETLAKKLGGGILTPATLGQPFIDRLQKAGMTLETKLMRD